MTAGKLFHKVAFLKREMVNPDYPYDFGNVVGVWVKQFTCRAEFVHLRGSETVMAGRLQGRHTQIIRVRRSSNTETIGRDWAVRDTATDTAFNIRDITPSNDRAFLDVLAESGVAI